MIINNKILNVDDYYYGVFVTISESLTGFTLNELQFTGLAEIYYRYILDHLQAATFTEFLNVSKNIIENSLNLEQLANAISANSI